MATRAELTSFVSHSVVLKSTIFVSHSQAHRVLRLANLPSLTLTA